MSILMALKAEMKNEDAFNLQCRFEICFSGSYRRICVEWNRQQPLSVIHAFAVALTPVLTHT